MKHARAVALAAAISLALIALSSRAEAQPLSGHWTGVVVSVDPATGPVTHAVTAYTAPLVMVVRWQCGRPTWCAAVGDQLDIGRGSYVMRPPSGSGTPGAFFLLTPNPDCVARYGSTARAGAWITPGAGIVARQCFTVTPPLNIRPRPDLPPIRLGPINLPPELRNPTGDERPTPRNQLPPGTLPRP